jgi:hypothetical protein
MRMLPIAAVLLGALSGTFAEALSQESGGGGRFGEVERRVEDAEDVIVEQVLALRRRIEALETRVRLLEGELAGLRRAPPPPRSGGPRPLGHHRGPPRIAV